VSDIAISFDSNIQAVAALEGAAYRLIGTATCCIERVADRYVCHLALNSSPRIGDLTPATLKETFLNLVTDENLRVRIAEKTDGVRNVILALAFGSLASSQKGAV
jgi:His-Xaa-Ser system protein HxsD